SFVAQLQKKLAELKIGILRLESADMDKLEFILTVEEDLDCSGLPITEESVCDYDEGFIAGILNEYTGKQFTAKEIDCWA
ncbi:MAG TPA: 4-vinyl reductase, partial [Sporomusaceae bacterium]|nr:4-vinyl reductase [Sporomusaceae bacterium]